MDCNQIINLFKEKMFNCGITPPKTIIADGNIHRFHVTGDKSGSKNGWYKLHLDGIPNGTFGSWKLGISEKWISTHKLDFSKIDRTTYTLELRRKEFERKNLIYLKKRTTAKHALNIWNQSRIADSTHPYLISKGIKNTYFRQMNEDLIVPLINIDNKIANIQYIHQNGDKKFLTGSVNKELFFTTGNFNKENELIITEGVATAIAFYERNRITTIAAMSTGNLIHVGQALRNYLSSSVKITFCADNDRFTKNNPGVTKATEAAKSIDAEVFIPEFPCSNCSCTDFNDLVLCKKGARHEQ